MCIIDFIDDHNGFFMVLITLVYMIATIAIWKANKQSAKAAEKQIQQAKEQLKESERQFEESQRLKWQPFLQMEEISTINDKKSFYIYLPLYYDDTEEYHHQGCVRRFFVLKNLGNGNAINLYYSWDGYPESKNETAIPPINAIMHGDEYGIKLSVHPKFQGRSCLTFYYNDLIGYEYYQKVFLIIDGTKISVENDIPYLSS